MTGDQAAKKTAELKRKFAVENAQKLMARQIDAAESLLEETKRFAARVDRLAAETDPDKFRDDQLTDIADQLDWFLNHMTQRHFDVPGIVSSIKELTKAQR